MNDQSNVRFKLNNSELWGGLIGLALGIFVIRSGLKLKLGTINDPGSGYVLFYTGMLMCVFAITIIVTAITEGGPTFASRWEGARWTKPLLVIACLIAFSFALGPDRLPAFRNPVDAAAVARGRPGALDAGYPHRRSGSARRVVGPATRAPDPVALGHLRNRLTGFKTWTHS